MTAQDKAGRLAKAGERRTVFIVDDDVDMSQSLESLLRSLSYRVESFNTAQAFLDRLPDGISGCLLLDVRLPTISGLEIQRRLAEAQHAVPIIFLTGHGDIQMAVSAMKAGAIEFLPKPFREQQLIDAVAEAMARLEEEEQVDRIRNAYLKDLALLSPKERDILDDLSSGLQIKEIAGKRGLSASTVRVHRKNIRSKVSFGGFGRFLATHNRFEMRSDGHG